MNIPSEISIVILMQKQYLFTMSEVYTVSECYKRSTCFKIHVILYQG